jgi:hypothetical protein
MTAPAVRQYYNRLLFSIVIRNERKRRHDFSVIDLESSSRLKLRLVE